MENLKNLTYLTPNQIRRQLGPQAPGTIDIYYIKK